MLNVKAINAAIREMAKTEGFPGAYHPTAQALGQARLLAEMSRASGAAKGYGWTRNIDSIRRAAKLYYWADITLAGLKGWMPPAPRS